MDTTNAKVLKELHKYAALYFSAIEACNTADNGKCRLKPGKYTAKELADHCKAACGPYILPADEMFNEMIEISADAFKCRFPYRSIFSILAKWEEISKAGKLKMIFESGTVEEKTAKVLIDQKTELGGYKTKNMKLQRLAGNWWIPAKFNKRGDDITLVNELNGVMYVPGLRLPADMILNRREEAEARCADFDNAKMTERIVTYIAQHYECDSWGYFKEVADRAGIDMESEGAAATIEKAKEEKRQAEERAEAERQESIRQREERERERKEREEQERREAAEHLVKAKENFISGKMISRKDFELIAESIGYEINIRTLGTLRKRITWIGTKDGNNLTVYGTETRRGLNGTFAVIREVYKLIKEQTEEANEPTKHISEIIESCPLHDSETGEETDEWRYHKWICNAQFSEYRTIAEQALIEALANIFEAAHRKGKGHIVAMNKHGVLIETVITAIDPPKSPGMPQAAQSPADTHERPQTPRKRPKNTIRRLRANPKKTIWRFQTSRRCLAACHSARVGGIGRTPPIRGDCTGFTQEPDRPTGQ